MKALSVACLTLVLASCTNNMQSLDVRNYYENNPLVAEQVATDEAQVMVNMIVNEKALLQQSDMLNEVDRMRIEAGKRAEAATKERKNGLLGQFNPHRQRALGFVLVRPKDGVIFTGTTFEADPGPELHMYASKAVDPRNAAFPDKGSIDLGLLPFPYGPQTLTFDAALWNDDFRTLVLYDEKLKRVYGFAQVGLQI